MTNAVIDCLMNHRSIRQFKPTPLEPETLDLILKAGIRAATAGNLQGYSLIVIDDQEKKKALWDRPSTEATTMVAAVVDQYRMKREEEQQDLLARDIRNVAQRVTLGHYTKEFIVETSKAIIENLKKSGFRLSDEGQNGGR